MPTASLASLSSSLKDSQTRDLLSPEKEREDREKFSLQTLMLTALTAINRPSHHPSFDDVRVNYERLQYMKEKASHTPILEAATTILVTDTEILATMAREVHAAHSIVALKEIKANDQDRLELRSKYYKTLEDIEDDFHTVENGPVTDEGHVPASKDVFVSLPNINKAIPTQESIDSSQKRSSDPICKPIVMGDGHWAQILESKKGFIFESTK
jgi:hypothetical protein